MQVRCGGTVDCKVCFLKWPKEQMVEGAHFQSGMPDLIKKRMRGVNMPNWGGGHFLERAHFLQGMPDFKKEKKNK